jgi:hypothetical protein
MHSGGVKPAFQWHGPDCAAAIGPAMFGEDASGYRVPVPGHARQEAVPDPRGKNRGVAGATVMRGSMACDRRSFAHSERWFGTWVTNASPRLEKVESRVYRPSRFMLSSCAGGREHHD